MRWIRVADSERTLPIGALLGAAAILALVGAAAWLTLGLPVPGCAMKEWTGVPCPTCGSTRLVRALANGHWLEAWSWNPLVFLGLVGLVAWAIASAVRRLLGWPVWRPVFMSGEQIAENNAGSNSALATASAAAATFSPAALSAPSTTLAWPARSRRSTASCRALPSPSRVLSFNVAWISARPIRNRATSMRTPSGGAD